MFPNKTKQFNEIILIHYVKDHAQHGASIFVSFKEKANISNRLYPE